MMDTTEQLYGPYRWDRYDILVLPPSFPYGGMENPRLTFATPTVITGDKSLVSLIAHELAHSWSGNLVTFATARDAWLNEGVTSYVENRVIEALYGKARADMERVIERNELTTEFTPANVALQPLAMKPGVLKDPGQQPDGAPSTRRAPGSCSSSRSASAATEFDAFLKAYFDHFAFQSISSAQFADYAQAHLLDTQSRQGQPRRVRRVAERPGHARHAPQTKSARVRRRGCARGRPGWTRARLPSPAVTKEWSTQEWVHFIEGMPATLTPAQIKALDAAYTLTGTPNGEIAQRWYPLTIRSGYTAARPAIADFLSRIGRRKLVMPTYRALAQTSDGLRFAREVFAKARPGCTRSPSARSKPCSWPSRLPPRTPARSRHTG